MVENYLNSIRENASALFDEAIEQLKGYLRIPTISAQDSAIPETVSHVVSMIENIGGETKVLDDLGGNPVVYGYFTAGENGDKEKTLLFYNHYDVQPPEPLEEWNTDPFNPTVIDGKLFARGASPIIKEI